MRAALVLAVITGLLALTGCGDSTESKESTARSATPTPTPTPTPDPNAGFFDDTESTTLNKALAPYNAASEKHTTDKAYARCKREIDRRLAAGRSRKAIVECPLTAAEAMVDAFDTVVDGFSSVRGDYNADCTAQITKTVSQAQTTRVSWTKVRASWKAYIRGDFKLADRSQSRLNAAAKQDIRFGKQLGTLSVACFTKEFRDASAAKAKSDAKKAKE